MSYLKGEAFVPSNYSPTTQVRGGQAAILIKLTVGLPSVIVLRVQNDACPSLDMNIRKLLDIVATSIPVFVAWSASVVEKGYSILLIIPGFGFHNIQRAAMVYKNLQRIHTSNVSYMCIIFNYEQPYARTTELSPEVRRGIHSHCSVQNYYYANYGDYLKSVPPALVHRAKFTHVFIVLDDVELKDTFVLAPFLDIMQRNNLSVATPAVVSGYKKVARPHPDKCPTGVGRTVKVFETYAAMFTTAAWECYYELLDPMVNNVGWSYERYLQSFCSTRIMKFRMGVIDTMETHHHAEFRRLTIRLPNYVRKFEMVDEQVRFWRAEITQRFPNITFVSRNDLLAGPCLV